MKSAFMKGNVGELPVTARVSFVAKLLNEMRTEVQHGRFIRGKDQRKKVAEIDLALGYLPAIDDDINTAKNNTIYMNIINNKFAGLMRRAGVECSVNEAAETAVQFIEQHLKKLEL